jgi:hypothetical protein
MLTKVLKRKPIIREDTTLIWLIGDNSKAIIHKCFMQFGWLSNLRELRREVPALRVPIIPPPYPFF